MNVYPWNASYPNHISPEFKERAMPLYTLAITSAKKFPSHLAIDFLGRHYTYQQLGTLIERSAAGFYSVGVKKGTVVALLLPNCPQFLIAYYGALMAGATVVCLSPLCSVNDLEAQINDSKATLLVTLDLIATYSKVSGFIGEGKPIRTAVVSSLKDALPMAKAVLFGVAKKKELAEIPQNSHHISWKKFLHQADATLFQAPSIDPYKDIAVLQYTGGTTGIPKAAILTHANLYLNALQCSIWLETGPAGTERMLAVLPFFHIFAMTTVLNYGMARGVTLIIHPKFELGKVLKDIHEKQPTLMPGVPTMYTAIINSPKLSRYSLSSIKACISGGAALPVEVKEKFEKLTGCTLMEGYGLTEASPVVAANPYIGKNKAGSIGLPIPGTIVAIEDMEHRGNFLGIGQDQVGELCVQGPQVMQGYLGRPDETAKCFVNGYLRTGDVGYIDIDGYIFIVDRLKEMIISGGFNIYPRHIEELLYQHPAILEAAVIGVKDEYRGEAPKACIVLKPGESLGKDAVLDYLRPKLAKYAIPREIQFMENLPKTMIGKISKKDLH